MFTTPLSAALYSNRNAGLLRSATTRFIYVPHKSSTGLRYICRKLIIDLHLLVLVVVCSVTQVCEGEVMVSGKPVSHWVEKLEDRDRREWAKALDALWLCNKDELNGARKRLRQMAVGGSILSRKAALILFYKFQEVDPKFADAYLVTDGNETFVSGRSAIIALARVDNSAASAAMLKKMKKLPDAGPMREDLLKLAEEIIAVRDGNQ